jgi:hypothetical protein
MGIYLKSEQRSLPLLGCQLLLLQDSERLNDTLCLLVWSLLPPLLLGLLL